MSDANAVTQKCAGCRTSLLSSSAYQGKVTASTNLTTIVTAPLKPRFIVLRYKRELEARLGFREFSLL
jgi:hypothetical protein